MIPTRNFIRRRAISRVRTRLPRMRVTEVKIRMETTVRTIMRVTDVRAMRGCGYAGWQNLKKLVL